MRTLECARFVLEVSQRPGQQTYLRSQKHLCCSALDKRSIEPTLRFAPRTPTRPPRFRLGHAKAGSELESEGHVGARWRAYALSIGPGCGWSGFIATNLPRLRSLPCTSGASHPAGPSGRSFFYQVWRPPHVDAREVHLKAERLLGPPEGGHYFSWPRSSVSICAYRSSAVAKSFM